MKSQTLWFLFAILITGTGSAQTYHLAEMNTEQIRALDREKTVILIPGGILEEHGPYLPSYTDGYADRYYTQKLADAIVAKQGWKAVIFPEIPLGFGGANNVGEKFDFPGTYTVRMSTLRSVYMDLAGDLGAQKFRWIFVVHDHGDPAHNQALAQASEYFHDTYGGTMVHLFNLAEVEGCFDTTAKVLSKKESEEDGFTIHAGAEEHSEVLFLHPELVNPGYKTARSLTGTKFEDLYQFAVADGWPGYFGAPSHASSELGRQAMEACSQKLDTVVLQVLNGADPHKLAHFYDNLDPRDAYIDKLERNHDREIEAKQEQWLKSKGLE
jgi:creatinine amidohydrolase